MDDELYKILFDYVKNQKWDKFKEELKKLDKNFDINIRDENYNYLLTYAILFNQPDVVELLMDRNAKIDSFDTEGFSILYIPIKFRFNNILDILLK